MRKQSVVLKHESDAALFGRHRHAVAGDCPPVDGHASALERLQSRGDPQHSGFAAAGRPEQAHDLTPGHRQADRVGREHVTEPVVERR